MNQTDIRSAAAQAAQKSKNLLGQQVDKQAAALGATLAQTAKDLQQVGSNLGESGQIGGAAQLANWAAGYVERAGAYLSEGHSDRFIADLEGFSRERPWAIASVTAALGFVAARIVKSSSVRRYASSTYVENYAYDSAAPTSESASTTPVYGASGN